MSIIATPKEKQELLFSYLCSSADLFVLTNKILEVEFFDAFLHRPITFVKDYYEKYKSLPNPEQLSAEVGYTVQPRTLTKSEFEYAINEVEQHCKTRALVRAITASVPLIAEDRGADIEKLIRDAIAVSINRNMGIDYFADPEARLRMMLQSNAHIPTGWNDVDDVLGGGVCRKEMTMFMANSGVGKSILMSNIAVNFTEGGLHVVYISLELSEEVVAKRFDSMYTGISQDQIFHNIPKVAVEVEKRRAQCGSLTIKRMPESTTNSNHIRSYLKEYELMTGHAPDILVVDYLDLLASNQKISGDNMFIKDKFVAEEVRSLADEYNMVVITASQMGRSALEADSHHQGHIQGGISKVNTTDNLIAIIQNEQQKAAGEYMLSFAKTRGANGVGRTVTLRWVPSALRVVNADAAAAMMKQVRFGSGGDMQVEVMNAELFQMTATPQPTKPVHMFAGVGGANSTNDRLMQLALSGGAM